jgi:16S rRNA processing protein RimM
MSALILLGRITGAHGIRGAVKIKSFTQNPADIASYGPLTTGDGRAIEIARLKPARDEFIADLKDVRDRNAAETMKGVELFIAREKLPAPKESEFYLSDLIGKNVLSDGVILGTVASIENYGAGDLMELANGELLPVAFIGAVGETITVSLPIGYLDPASHEDQHH